MFDMSEIEQQHREINNLLNTMNEAVKSHESRKEIYRIFDDVISYSELHFATEERLMVQSGFPETEAHKNYHKQLLTEARLFREKLHGIGEDVFREWFNHWYYANVVTHFLYADKQIEDYIRRSDIQQ
jgi:hemerythrin-like metal-binding protein